MTKNLKKMKNNKDFDTVKMMREIRDKHHTEYGLNPELRKKRLDIIKEKYAHRIKKREFSDH